jgi:hypothetical protein
MNRFCGIGGHVERAEERAEERVEERRARRYALLVAQLQAVAGVTVGGEIEVQI